VTEASSRRSLSKKLELPKLAGRPRKSWVFRAVNEVLTNAPRCKRPQRAQWKGFTCTFFCRLQTTVTCRSVSNGQRACVPTLCASPGRTQSLKFTWQLSAALSHFLRGSACEPDQMLRPHGSIRLSLCCSWGGVAWGRRREGVPHGRYLVAAGPGRYEK
jgi:hypothetical protein